MLPSLIWRSAPRGCKASNQLITMLGAATSGKRSSSNGYNAPDALEHFLESYQHDLLRKNEAGVAISLHAIARIYSDEHEYDRARERIREGLPFENLWRHLLTSGEFQDSSSERGIHVRHGGHMIGHFVHAMEQKLHCSLLSALDRVVRSGSSPESCL